MRAVNWSSVIVLCAAAMQAGAAFVPTQQNNAVEERGPHPKHPKHPHPHPHPHPTSTKHATKTSSTPAATSTSTGPQISCASTPLYSNVALLNTFSFYLTAVDDPRAAFPNPHLTFPTQDSQMTVVGYDAKHTRVNVYDCKSTFMGYDGFANNDPYGYADVHYAIIRVPTRQNACIVATAPGGSPTYYKLAPCSFTDDASQEAQLFYVSLTDQGTLVNLLGAPYAQAQDQIGLHYQINTDFNSGDAFYDVRQDDPTEDFASFYLGNATD